MHSKCIRRSGKEHFPARSVRQYYSNAKTRGQLFCKILLNFAPSSVCSWSKHFAHEEYHVLHLWQENDGNDTVFRSSHSIKWFIISVCPNIDDVHLDHLIKVVAVKLLHCQVTLPYLVIETFFCVLKYIYIYIIPLQNLDLLI